MHLVKSCMVLGEDQNSLEFQLVCCRLSFIALLVAYVANLEESIVSKIPDSTKNGIYFGWAKLSNTPVYKMVMSIGWNPYFKNIKRSVEVHILHRFEENFYGDTIKVIAVKYFRPEYDFPSIGDLIKQIHTDISEANLFLNKSEALLWSKHDLFNEKDR
ncbi:unnamed protein product [Schistosoma rodhaini]|uniref:riboflavin kinase n=1 Tax=Schistosoma rodhaini TaxID=6188 RepID=A0AA85GC92_9TREM|nr:unnamed protein product [Schistosoma rodhaini]